MIPGPSACQSPIAFPIGASHARGSRSARSAGRGNACVLCHRDPGPDRPARALIFFWWLVDPARWQLTFGGPLVPALGFLFLPWTTLMYTLFWAAGSLSLLSWLFIAVALVADIGTYGGGFFGNRGQMSNYRD